MQAIMEVETIMTLETITNNLQITVQWKAEILVAAGTWVDHMVEVLYMSWLALESEWVGF